MHFSGKTCQKLRYQVHDIVVFMSHAPTMYVSEIVHTVPTEVYTVYV